MEMANLIDDDILKEFAVVGGPADVGAQIAARFKGKVDRVSPVVYTPDVELLSTLQNEIRKATAA